MHNRRREFFKDLLITRALQAFAGSPAAARSMVSLLDQSTAQDINPDFDAKAFNFWSGFLASNADPIVWSAGQTRGKSASPESDVQPVFMHDDSDGFKNAVDIDTSKLRTDGDVAVSLNTSTIKIAPEDQKTFDRLQNAQLGVGVVQRTAIVPVIEAMA